MAKVANYRNSTAYGTNNKNKTFETYTDKTKPKLKFRATYNEKITTVSNLSV
jgi:hypothetical protein